LILLASGPRAGLNEIDLPAIQPGSSIMPGKVNPVVPEVMNLVTFRVIGNDLVVTLAAHSGQLQLNAYEPVEGVAMMESQSLLFNTSKLMRTKCVDGIVVDEKQLAHYMETTVGIVTALNPILGYEKATERRKRRIRAAREFSKSFANNTCSRNSRSKNCLTRPSLPISIHRNTNRRAA
jgi:aspartate ammonia-lyase